MTGIVFDIREFTVHDGPGSRVTVFLKGCPLRCKWCHNPEGLVPRPQLMKKTAQCTGCGSCRRGCAHEECQSLGVCLHACPRGLLSMSGTRWEAGALAAHLRRYERLLPEGGGITFSGGEPLMQGEFVAETAQRLHMHTALQTSGYAPDSVFRQALRHMDYVLMDIKLADPEEHLRYTGVRNEQVLRNYYTLLESGVPHAVRVPLIPGVTDTEANLRGIAAITEKSHVELMRYNPLAGAKYPMLELHYDFVPSEPGKVDLSLFRSASFV